MGDAVRAYLPWLLSALTIYTMFLAGDRKSYTWLVGLANQALWLVWIVAASAWGLLPMNLALWFVYGRNHLKWARNRRNLPAKCDESNDGLGQPGCISCGVECRSPETCGEQGCAYGWEARNRDKDEAKPTSTNQNVG